MLEKNQFKRSILLVFAVPVLTYLIAFVILPEIFTVLLSFKDYTIYGGILKSPFCGFENYRQALTGTQKAFLHSGQTSLMIILFGALYIGLITYGLSNLKSKMIRVLICCAVLLPMFVDKYELLSFLCRMLQIRDHNDNYSIVVAIFNILRSCSFYIAAGFLWMKDGRDEKKLRFLLGLFVGIKLISFFSIGQYVSVNAPVHYDLLDKMLYRTILIDIDYSGGAALNMILYAFKLPFVILGILVLLRSWKRYWSSWIVPQHKDSTIGGKFFCLAVLIPLCIISAVYWSSFPGLGIDLPYIWKVIQIAGSRSIFRTLGILVFCLIYTAFFQKSMPKWVRGTAMLALLGSWVISSSSAGYYRVFFYLYYLGEKAPDIILLGLGCLSYAVLILVPAYMGKQPFVLEDRKKLTGILTVVFAIQFCLSFFTFNISPYGTSYFDVTKLSDDAGIRALNTKYFINLTVTILAAVTAGIGLWITEKKQLRQSNSTTT